MGENEKGPARLTVVLQGLFVYIHIVHRYIYTV